MDRRIKFRQLEVFTTVARAASLKRAASQLNLTQPAVSKTLKELEAIVGQTLADRSRAGVRLTPNGELFLTYAEQAISAVQNGMRSLRNTASSGGRLKIGALPSVASSVLPPATMRYVAQNPDTLLEVFEGPHADLTARLRAGGLDMVVGRLGRPETMDGLSFQQLYAEDVVIVARPDSPAAGLTSVHDLDAYRVIYPPMGSAIRPLVARMLIGQGVPLFANRIETASAAYGRALVLADPLMVWIISQGVVTADLRAGILARLDIALAETRGAVGIMTRSNEVLPATVRGFARHLTRYCGRRTTLDSG